MCSGTSTEFESRERTSLVADPTQAQINTLDPEIAWRAAYLINVLRDIGWPVGIVALGARRNETAQKALVREGRSRTLRSRHIDGLAFDLDILGVPRDEVPEWFWNALGPWAEQALGLRWGGRFSTIRDLAHFELP